MAGYNSFCEVLSFDKPALLVPRQAPRREQLIRAQRAQDLGLARMMLVPANPREGASNLATALHRLIHEPPPSQSGCRNLLEGTDATVRAAVRLISARQSILQPERLR
jgi:predicted glycosyltransferase